MHDKIHPLGSTNKDITYEHFYEYLNCLNVSPCAGLMNSNETIRNLSFEAAKEMRERIPLIVDETADKLKNIKVFYLGNVMDDALNNYLNAGGDPV